MADNFYDDEPKPKPKALLPVVELEKEESESTASTARSDATSGLSTERSSYSEEETPRSDEQLVFLAHEWLIDSIDSQAV